jgi:hypothetical protein
MTRCVVRSKKPGNVIWLSTGKSIKRNVAMGRVRSNPLVMAETVSNPATKASIERIRNMNDISHD